jgi:hypothetical protein
MVTVLEDCTTREQSSLVQFLQEKGVSSRKIHKEMFLVYGGSVFRVKWFRTGSRNSLKDVRKSQILPDQVRKWLRQQSKDLYVAGFDALVKQWDMCINVDGGYVEK